MTKLTDDQRAKVERFLTDNIRKRPCQFCGSADWKTGDRAVTVPHFNATTGATLLHKSVPAIYLRCVKCGHLELFAAATIGILPGQAE